MQCLVEMTICCDGAEDGDRDLKFNALLQKLADLGPGENTDLTKLDATDIDTLCSTFQFIAREYVRLWFVGKLKSGLESALHHLNRAVMFSETGKHLIKTGRNREHTLLPIRCLLDRARVFMLTKHYYELAAADYLESLFMMTKHHSPDASLVALAELREKLTFNTSLAYRFAGSLSLAEGVIYAAFGLNPLQQDFPERRLSIPLRLRALVEVFRMARAIDSSNDLMASILMLNTAAPSISTNPRLMASALGLVQLSTQYFLCMQLSNRLTASGDHDETGIAEKVCDEYVAAVTGGEVLSIRSCLADGLPSQIMGASKLVRHAFVTVMDFCTSFHTLALWSSIKHEVNPSLRLGDMNVDPQNTWSPSSVPVFPPTCGVHDIDTSLVVQMLEEFDRDELENVDELLDPSLLGILAPVITSPNFSHGAEKGISEEATTGLQWKEAASSFVPMVTGLVEYQPALSEAQRKALHQQLPIESQNMNWHCSYTTKEHGVSLTTLLGNTLDLEPVLLVAWTATNVIGAFIPSSLQVTTRFCGRGGTFIFSFPVNSEAEDQGIQTFRWSGRNEYFVMIKPSSGISIGGGATGSAILLHPDLFTGNSYPCATFSSPPLSPTDEGTGFDVYRVDIYSFPKDF